MSNEFASTTEDVSTVSNVSELDKKALVQKLNDEMAQLMIPATVYISILMVLGLVGNIMVCYYYGFKTKQTTNSFFVVVLALYDITVCAFCMPTEIADIELFYTFENNAACKILRFVNYLAGIGSILTLIAIATDRFKNICKATSLQISMRTTKMISIAVFGGAFLLSWPSLAIYGSIKVNIPNDLGIELKGSDCTSTKDRQYRKYVWAFNIIHFLLFFVCSTVLVVLYSIIGHTIYKHHRNMRKYKCASTIASSSNETSFSSDSIKKDHNAGGKNDPLSDNGETNATKTKMPPGTSQTRESKKEKTRKSAAKGNGQSRTIDRETVKLTVIMVVVTVVFIISFLPYLSLTVWRVKEGKHEAEFLSGAGLVGFKIGSRSFLLNNTLNPWIYGIFNTKFRRFFFGWISCKKANG